MINTEIILLSLSDVNSSILLMEMIEEVCCIGNRDGCFFLSKENRERQSRKSALSAIGWDVAYGRKENLLAVLFRIHCFLFWNRLTKREEFLK